MSLRGDGLEKVNTGDNPLLDHLYDSKLDNPLLSPRTKKNPITLGPTDWLPKSLKGKPVINRGLFANLPIKNLDKITPYAGEIAHIRLDNITTTNTSYAFGLYRADEEMCVIQGFQKPKNGYGMGQFCNDRGPSKANAKIIKCTRPQDTRKEAYLMATKPINVGEEILIHHGKTYWKRFETGRNTGPYNDNHDEENNNNNNSDLTRPDCMNAIRIATATLTCHTNLGWNNTTIFSIIKKYFWTRDTLHNNALTRNNEAIGTWRTDHTIEKWFGATKATLEDFTSNRFTFADLIENPEDELRTATKAIKDSHIPARLVAFISRQMTNPQGYHTLASINAINLIKGHRYDTTPSLSTTQDIKIIITENDKAPAVNWQGFQRELNRALGPTNITWGTCRSPTNNYAPTIVKRYQQHRNHGLNWYRDDPPAIHCKKLKIKPTPTEAQKAVISCLGITPKSFMSDLATLNFTHDKINSDNAKRVKNILLQAAIKAHKRRENRKANNGTTTKSGGHTFSKKRVAL
jgi:hypothetical protein